MDRGPPLLEHRSPVDVANEIRETVKAETGLTVSIGVSFNKIFAKLGSDMKKPDAVTEIWEDTFRTRSGPSLCRISSTLAAPPRTSLPDMASIRSALWRKQNRNFCSGYLGRNGLKLWIYANGKDTSRVMPCDYEPPVKSIGHGITCTADLATEYEVRQVLLELSQEVGRKLRKQHLAAAGVRIYVRGLPT